MDAWLYACTDWGRHRPLSRKVVYVGKYTEKLKIWVNGWQISRRIEGLAGKELEERDLV